MATQKQIETIEERAYNDVARAMQAEGVELTHEQADALGVDALDWLRDRLGLRVRETDSGVLAIAAIAVRSDSAAQQVAA